MTSLPSWLLKKTVKHHFQKKIRKVLGDNTVHSVCESAKCPNRGECFEKSTMAFLILGDRCSRSCKFCGVAKGKLEPIDHSEPSKVADAVAKLGIRHVVLTSVTRDDLPDGGVEQFLRTVELIKKMDGTRTIEVLTPDFQGKENLWSLLLQAPLDVFNHNIETVPRLYPKVRSEARYDRSLGMLRFYKDRSSFKIKSGLIVGMGEEDMEVLAVLDDLKRAGCDIVTIGQYLRPSLRQIPIRRYVAPERFLEYASYGEQLGLQVFAGPWVRSSYQAEEVMLKACA